MEESMIRKMPFDEVVEAVDSLCADDQKELMNLLQRRIAEQGRRQIVSDVVEGRNEMAQGRATLLDIDDLARDLRK
jgi:hypothetical protein